MEDVEIINKSDLVEWLDMQALCFKKMEKARSFNDDIRSLEWLRNSIQISGALKICEVLNIPFTMKKWENGNAFAEEVTFYWNGVKFLSLENYREEK